MCCSAHITSRASVSLLGSLFKGLVRTSCWSLRATAFEWCVPHMSMETMNEPMQLNTPRPTTLPFDLIVTGGQLVFSQYFGLEPPPLTQAPVGMT